MENLGLHKVKLYALMASAVAIIALFLPWQTFSAATFYGTQSGSINGYNGWGWVSFIGVLAVIVATFMSDKSKMYDDMGKNIALGGFGGVIGGTIAFLIRVLTVKTGGGFSTSPGFGLFICSIAGIAGIVIVMGKVKLPDIKTGGTSTPPTPPGPSTPKPPPPTNTQI